MPLLEDAWVSPEFGKVQDDSVLGCDLYQGSVQIRSEQGVSARQKDSDSGLFGSPVVVVV